MYVSNRAPCWALSMNLWTFEPFINQSWTSTGSMLFGRLPKSPYCTKITRSFFQSSHTPVQRTIIFQSVPPYKYRWNLLLWTPGGLPLHVMHPWEVKWTFVLWIKLWIWTHFPVIPPYCFLSQWKKTGGWFNPRWDSQLQDLGLNCLPLLP